MKRVIFAITIFFASNQGMAFTEGRLVGNGGDGLWIENKLYNLDLVEAGVQDEPNFVHNPIHQDFTGSFHQKFVHIKKFPLRRLQEKFTEIREKSPRLAYAMAAVLLEMNWSVVSQELLPIDDEESPLNFKKEKLVQLAARRDLNVFINKNYWSLLDEENQVALITHEVIYALMPALNVDDSDQKRQSSIDARALNGQLYRANWQERDFSDWMRISVFTDSNVNPDKIPVNSEYRMKNGRFAWARPGQVIVNNNFSRPYSLADLTKNNLESICLGSPNVRTMFFSQPIQKLMVAPLGEELALQKEAYCQSLDRTGKCVMQIALHFEPEQRNFQILSNRNYESTATRLGRGRGALNTCISDLFHRLKNIAENPYSEEKEMASLVDQARSKL